MRACLDRIAAREAEVGAWAYVDPDTALAAARAFDQSGRRGPLAGVPFGVKDIIDTVDMPTEWGTPIHKGRQPGARRRLRRAVPQGRRHAARQDRHHRVRQPASRQDPQPARPRRARPAARRAARPRRSPISWCRSRSARRPPARPSVRRRSAACSAIGRPTASIACTASWRPPARSTRSASWRARSRTSRSTATCCSASRRSRSPPLGRPPHIALCRSHVWDQFEPTTRTLVEDAALPARPRRRPYQRVRPAGRLRAAERRAPLDFQLRVRPHLHVGDREPLGRDQRHAARRTPA